jgi:hypothetical protein
MGHAHRGAAAALVALELAAPAVMAGKLLELASRVDPFRVRTRKRGPKTRQSTPYVEAATARSHHSTARPLKRAREKTS